MAARGTGRVVVVTGASAGIGRATADRLAGAGWTVVGVSRRGTGGEGWSGRVVDVDDDGSVADGIAAVLADHGRIDAVVQSAGWGVAGSVERTDLAAARAQVETNLWGSVRVVQAVLPVMRAQGGGRIVLLSSIGGVVSIPFQGFYSASKFALEGLGEALAHEVRPFGVEVTLVQPGNVRTDFTASRVLAQRPGPDPYGQALAHAVGVMERDEQAGIDPARVAEVVERVLGARRPPRRVSVGRLGERVGLPAKRLLPYRWFERAAKGSLGVR